MTDDERELLAEIGKHLVQLFQDRDDLVVGVTAALLDLYREEFEAGRQSKETTLQRLTISGKCPDGQDWREISAGANSNSEREPIGC